MTSHTQASEKVTIGITRGESGTRDYFSGDIYGSKFVPTLILYATPDREGGRTGQQVGNSVASILGNNVTVETGHHFGPDTPSGGGKPVARIRVSVANENEQTFLQILAKNIKEAGNTISASVVQR